MTKLQLKLTMVMEMPNSGLWVKRVAGSGSQTRTTLHVSIFNLSPKIKRCLSYNGNVNSPDTITQKIIKTDPEFLGKKSARFSEMFGRNIG